MACNFFLSLFYNKYEFDNCKAIETIELFDHYRVCKKSWVNPECAKLKTEKPNYLYTKKTRLFRKNRENPDYLETKNPIIWERPVKDIEKKKKR